MSKQQKKTAVRVTAVILFLLYVSVLIYLLFFSPYYGRTERFTEYHYNLIPFAEIRRYIHNHNASRVKLLLRNIGGNVLAFIPFGFLLPLVDENERGFFRVVGIGFLFSLTVETIQLLLMVGTFDVDDIFLNILGVVLGHGIHFLLFRNKSF